MYHKGGFYMSDDKSKLTAEQYSELYRRAYIQLSDISALANQALHDLEELQLTMGDKEKLFGEF